MAPWPTPAASRRTRRRSGSRVDGETSSSASSRPATDFPTIVAAPDVRDRAARRSTPGRGRSSPGTASSAAAATSLTAATDDADDPDGERPLLGRPAGDRDGRARPRHRRTELRAAFEDGDVDLTAVSPFDATWLAYDDTLGPLLRRTDGCRSSTTASTLAAAVRRRPGPPGVRPGRRLAAADRARRRRRGDTRDGDGPARHPGPERRRLPAGPRSGRRPGAARRWRAIPGGKGFPTIDAARRRRDRWRGVRRRDQARARRDGRGRGPGRRVLRPARRPTRRRSSRWAGSPTTRARTTSSASCSAAGASNNYGRWSSPTFDQAIADALPRTRSGGGAGRVRPCRGHRPRRGPDDPAHLRRGLVAGAERAARRVCERARDHPDGGAGMAALSPPARSGLGACSSRSWRSRRPSARWRRSPPPSRSASARRRATSTFGKGIDFDSRSRSTPRSAPGRAPDRPRRDRSARSSARRRRRRRGRDDARLPARHERRHTSSRTRPSRPSGGSAERTARRLARADRGGTTRTIGSTGRRSRATSCGSTGSRATRRSASGR